MRRPRPAVVAAALAAAAGCVAGSAPAAVAQSRGGASAAHVAAKPFFDARGSLRREVARRGGRSLRAPSASTRVARSRMRGAVDVDALTGTPRVLGGAGEPLSGPTAGDPADVAMHYVREHLTLLGLTEADLGTLRLEPRVRGAGGTVSVPFSQFTDGIPAFDSSLKVVVAADGSVLRVLGAPQHALGLGSTTPLLTAPEAMRRLRDNVGAKGEDRVVRGPSGVTRRHEFASGDTAELVAFGEGDSARLGWKVSARGPGHAWYAAVVDADTGAILYRSNRTRMDNEVSVWEQYPGATNGGIQQPQNITQYLDAPTTAVLSGPNAKLWSDLNDNFFDQNGAGTVGPENGEQITKNGATFAYTFDEFTSAENQFGACLSAKKCSWNYDAPDSWQTNRLQNGVQTFWYVNRFRDHLAAPPISFSTADGDFQGADRVMVNTDDGADTDTVNHRPDDIHIDNAFMSTPPDGMSPVMGMFLFVNNGDFRDVNGGDDAAIVYHEYTHGLSSRLVTVAPNGGEQALNEEQAGAMGEGWSDWYAKDFLINQFPADDDPSTPGEVDMGKYTDSVPHTIRNQALDCPVGAAAAQCPASGIAGSGGWTYGDYLKIQGTPEVHSDGEIWAQTLWDVRAALGSPVAEAIITEGMRNYTPAEPSFLDARDAIIAADKAIFGQGADTAALWQVFAKRGMGTDALAGVNPDPAPDAPIEGFNRPPTVTLNADPLNADIGDTISFDATAADPDPGGGVVSYHWDFGDGQTADTPSSSTSATISYAANDRYTASVTATDNVDGQESATVSIRIGPEPTPTPTPTPSATPTPTPTATATPTATPTPPPPSVKPIIRLPRSGSRARVRFSVTCDSACSGTAKLRISKALARELGLGRQRTLVVRRVSLSRAGTKRYTLKLSSKVTRAMRRKAMRRLKTSLNVSVRDAELQRASASRAPRIRR